MKRYVLGFVFNHNLTKVLLIEKKRGPNDQVGKWNGIGGNVNDDERYVEAIGRECDEEAGLAIREISPDDNGFTNCWVRFCTLGGFGYQIACFYARMNDDVFDTFKSYTDEKVEVWSVYPIVLAGSLPLAPGVTWMIEMARAHARGEDANYYTVNRQVL